MAMMAVACALIPSLQLAAAFSAVPTRLMMQTQPQPQPSASPTPSVTTTDVVVIGSGIGGLSAGGMAAAYGLKTTVLESHYLPGGVAHSFNIEGYQFDAGPSLWAGVAESSTNPLRQVLDITGVADDLTWVEYTGWQMLVPNEDFRFTVGQTAFEDVIRELGGEGELETWHNIKEKVRPLLRAAVSIPSLALRGDAWGALLLAPFLVQALLLAGPTVQSLQVRGAFTSVSEGVVPKGTFLERWFDYLAFALSGLPADSTMAAAVIYTMGDLHRPGAALHYPIGGGGAVIDAMCRGIESHGGEVRLKSHVEEILVEDGRAVGVRLRNGSEVRASTAVISNASVWDTMKLLPKDSVPDSWLQECESTPAVGSFMHLHLGIDAAGLEGKLDIHYSTLEGWGDDMEIDAPENMCIVSIPTVLDPSLAPQGKHLVHIYTAGNEPYEVWEDLKRGSPEYQQLKERRAEVMWRGLERIIPDIRSRVEVELCGSPLTHEFFNRRFKGSYGPLIRAGEGEFPGPTTPLPGLLRCGDSCLPGLGLGPAAASGMFAANTIVPVHKHFGLLWEANQKGWLQNQFKGF
ncbi:unnamed protein product [Chrysoparadoxa australica]